MNNVTVIVPIYKHWVSLSNCIEYLKKFLKSENKVILVNDMGNEWQELEDKILAAIAGCPQFYYERNESNLGFVMTCNRAVYELDKTDNDILLLNSDTAVTEGFLEEMQKVLYADEKIGVVCPRSNKSTFLSVPMNSNGVNVSAEESYAIYSRIRNFLPDMEEIWTGVGFAFLIRRSLIRETGLFDEVFGRGYNEENDFCMRIKKKGYRIMKANNAFVYHMEGKSFEREKEKLELKNSSLLLKRYPYYWDGAEFFKKHVDVVDYYADLLTDVVYTKKRILICILRDLRKKELIAILDKCLQNKEINRYYFEILTTTANAGKAARRYKGISIHSNKTLKGTFHMAYSLFELTELEKALFNGYSPFWITCKEFDLCNIESDIKNMCILNDDTVQELRKRWNYYNKENDWSIDKKKDINLCIKKVKNYLYANHIWLFLLWRKLRKH